MGAKEAIRRRLTNPYTCLADETLLPGESQHGDLYHRKQEKKILEKELKFLCQN